MKRIKVQPLDMTFTLLYNPPLKFSLLALVTSLSVLHFYQSELLALPQTYTFYNSPYLLFLSPLLKYTSSLLYNMYYSVKILYIFVRWPPWYLPWAHIQLIASFLLVPFSCSSFPILSSYHMDVLVCCHGNPSHVIKLGDPSGRNQCLPFLSIFPSLQPSKSTQCFGVIVMC